MRVTLSRDYVSADGKKAKADATVDLPTDEARNLLYEGGARLPDEKKAEAPATTTTPKKEAN